MSTGLIKSDSEETLKTVSKFQLFISKKKQVEVSEEEEILSAKDKFLLVMRDTQALSEFKDVMSLSDKVPFVTD
jgi:hypothetical protein